MRKNLSLLLLLLLPLLALAQAVTVPKNVYVADVQIKISDRAQQEIQKKVDALHRNQNYFRYRVELADAYFPLIERVFKEEGVPDDLKYLAIQESGLIGDAVSTSNAVGYWQFKKEAASDFNLQMNSQVDERRHIIEASRGAARYFNRSNAYYNNWFNTILSYYLGPTGAKSYTSTSDIGSRKMEVTEKTHQYLLTYLAHKIAYENFVGKNTPPSLMLSEMRGTPGQSLLDIALATQIDAAELEKYNKWLLGGTIPSGKDYYVMVPVRNGAEPALLASKEPVTRTTRTSAKPTRSSITKRNNLTAIVAGSGDTKQKLASQAGLSVRKFQRYNDMQSFDEVEAGGIYYLEAKRTSAETEYHVAQPGETMLQISQHYGIRLKYLLFKNRMARYESPEPGRVLWLQKRRPARTPVEIREPGKAQPVSTSAGTAVAATTATAPSTKQAQTKTETDKQPAAKKENFFTRLFAKLKGKKAQPAEIEHVAVGEAEVFETVEDPEPVAVPEKPAAATKPAPAEEAKPAAVLYPGTGTGTTAPAVAQPKKETPAAPVATVPATPKKETASATAVAAAKPVAVKEAPAAAPQPGPAPAVGAGAGTTRHVVQQGETLYGISRLYAVSVVDLVSWNNLGEEPLRMGQELLISRPASVPAQAAAPAVASSAAEAVAPVAPAVKTAPAAQEGHATHVVAPGETLYQISKKYGVTLDELRSWNNLEGNSISIGQELHVQAPASQPEAEATPEVQPAAGTRTLYHTVETGESMYQISRKYGVTIKDIMEWNKKSDFNVAIGEKLLIKQP
ncbi:LysM peptidoglycan-binding domain-containing protein [Botryobacter ruber]|uniref:LysM peptidoglycan-binding domain-containing protein n=1 Tax=Botryobacter ruber TaxID=2171629 RepID=UPI000E0B0148|nr:LysM peptidoglycan-binding domain-containing protein [Botryobacter ruber]